MRVSRKKKKSRKPRTKKSKHEKFRHYLTSVSLKPRAFKGQFMLPLITMCYRGYSKLKDQQLFPAQWVYKLQRQTRYKHRVKIENIWVESETKGSVPNNIESISYFLWVTRKTWKKWYLKKCEKHELHPAAIAS